MLRSRSISTNVLLSTRGVVGFIVTVVEGKSVECLATVTRKTGNDPERHNAIRV